MTHINLGTNDHTTTGRPARRGLAHRVAFAFAFLLTWLAIWPLAQAQHNRHQLAAQTAELRAEAAAEDKARADDRAAHERDFEDRRTALMFKLDCTTGDTWKASRPGQYPASMVVQPVNAAGLWTWDLVVLPWSMDRKVIAGGVVQLLCARGA